MLNKHSLFEITLLYSHYPLFPIIPLSSLSDRAVYSSSLFAFCSLLQRYLEISTVNTGNFCSFSNNFFSFGLIMSSSFASLWWIELNDSERIPVIITRNTKVYKTKTTRQLGRPRLQIQILKYLTESVSSTVHNPRFGTGHESTPELNQWLLELMRLIRIIEKKHGGFIRIFAVLHWHLDFVIRACPPLQRL